MKNVAKHQILLLLVLFTPYLSAQTADIVVSIKPLHSLVQAIIGDTHTVHLLVQDKKSPHRMILKPSQRRLLHTADSVFYIDNNYEFFIPAALNNNGYRISEFALLQTYPLRTLHTHNDDDDAHHNDNKRAIDPHLWLDINNAKIIVRHIQEIVTQHYPQHATLYKNNAIALRSRLNKLHTELASTLTPNQQKPYVVLHDAYQYFEKHFNLQQGIAIYHSTAIPASANRIQTIRQLINDSGIRCAFIEPQLPRKMMDAIIDNPQHIYLLDPLGADINAGAELYFKLMRQMTKQLRACLD